MQGMVSYTQAAMERVMKVQEVIGIAPRQVLKRVGAFKKGMLAERLKPKNQSRSISSLQGESGKGFSNAP
jgi:hypothetical protein